MQTLSSSYLRRGGATVSIKPRRRAPVVLSWRIVMAPLWLIMIVVVWVTHLAYCQCGRKRLNVGTEKSNYFGDVLGMNQVYLCLVNRNRRLNGGLSQDMLGRGAIMSPGIGGWYDVRSCRIDLSSSCVHGLANPVQILVLQAHIAIIRACA